MRFGRVLLLATFDELSDRRRLHDPIRRSWRVVEPIQELASFAGLQSSGNSNLPSRIALVVRALRVNFPIDHVLQLRLRPSPYRGLRM